MISPWRIPTWPKAISNRLWAHFLGRGLVEPLDDMRVTNPPSNPELLERDGAQDFVAHKFDLKHLMRTILVSTTYQLSPEPNEVNRYDRQNYARSYPRRLTAEVMVDGVNQITETSEGFEGLPEGMRAIALPDESVASLTFWMCLDVRARIVPAIANGPATRTLAQSLQIVQLGGDRSKRWPTSAAAWLGCSAKGNPTSRSSTNSTWPPSPVCPGPASGRRPVPIWFRRTGSGGRFAGLAVGDFEHQGICVQPLMCRWTATVAGRFSKNRQ